MKHFQYIQAASPAEASSKISQLGEDEARVIAGGTALVIMMKEKVLTPKILIDISQIKSMRGIAYSQDKGLSIGSMATHLEIESSPFVAAHYPSLKDAFHTIGNVRVRTVGTIGGNLAYAEPQCNPPAILSALDAIVHTKDSLGKERSIPAGEFILGIFESALKPGEMITHVTVPAPRVHSACSFYKFTTKSSTDKPTSTVAVYIELDRNHKRAIETRIVVGAVGPKTYRCLKAETFVKESSDIQSLDFKRAASIAAGEFEPMDDLYGPAWYKKEVTESIIRDLLRKTITDAANSAPIEKEMV
ncbi:MAG: FAD binding domain-containing protein [Nitrososphaerales archaeon]